MNNRLITKPHTAALTLLVLAACSLTSPQQPTVTSELPSPALASPSAPITEPSPTPPELAAVVNGEPILMADYQAHLARFEDAQSDTGTLLATEDAPARVLEDMINRLLLAQGARQVGFAADDAMIEQRLAQIAQESGGPEAFSEWMNANHYTEERFRRELVLEMEAAWMRQQIVAQVPEKAEQVLARQVLFYTPFEADRVYAQLEDGTLFDTIVANNDPEGLGYLGWFPRGYLFHPALEEAAFSLQPGEYSAVIKTDLGYHILQVLDRDPDRPLSANARLVFQSRLLDEWLDEKRAQSEIQIFLP